MARSAKAPVGTAAGTPPPIQAETAALIVAALLVSIGGGTMLDRVSIGRDASARALYLVPAAMLALAAGLGRSLLVRRSLPAPGGRFGLASAWAALSLAVWSVVSLAGTQCMQLGIYALLVLALGLGAALLSAGAAGNSESRTAALLGWVGAASLVAAMGLNEYLVAFRGGDVTWRVFAGFNNPNLLAGYMAVILPVTAVLFLGARERSMALALGTALALQSACLLLTQSRLGILALALGLVVTAALAGRSLLAGPARPRMLALLALAALAIGIGARPLMKRMSLAGDQSYSARFRTETWRGAARMALAHPLVGTGVGSFEVAYPRYAVVGYTQHAHSSYVQVAAETGLPGAMFLVIGLVAAIVAAGASTRSQDPSGNTGQPAWAAIPPRLVGAGLAGALTTAAIHNLFDSDLYVPAIAMLAGALAGLAAGLSTATAGRAVPGWLRHARAVVGVGLALGGVTEAVGRGAMASAWDAAMARNPRVAADLAAPAGIAEPLNLWNTMDMAAFSAAAGDRTAADASYRKAIQQAPIAVTFYRYARWLESAGRDADALRMFERSRQLDPINLGNLVRLAQAYRKTGRPAEASAIYRGLVAMEAGPIGKLRAVPEVVEWEYGEAHLALAEDALAAGDKPAALREIQAGLASLDELWRKRDVPQTMATTRPEVLDTVGDRLIWARTELRSLLTGTPGAAANDAELSRLRDERAARGAPANAP